MILPHVNLLIYSFYEPAPEHAVYASWLAEIRRSGDLLLPSVVLTGFLRIVTNPRVIAVPPPTAQATLFVTALRNGPGAREVVDERTVWRSFDHLVDGDPQIRANLIPDAVLAAIAISHGARLATHDRGFARFPGLRWFDPAAG